MNIYYTLQEYIFNLATYYSNFNFPISILDIIIVLVIAFYIYEGYKLGFIIASTDLAGFILSFLISLKLYSPVGALVASVFSIPPGFSNALSFFVLALIAEVILSVLFRKGIHKLKIYFANKEIPDILARAENYAGVIPGLLSALIILSFIFTVIISLPSSPVLKNAVTNSTIGSKLISHAQDAELTVNELFGGALYETLSFMTVDPSSEESLELKFTVKDPIVDKISEEDMIDQINIQRRKEGLSELVMDEALRKLGRDYAKEMLQEGYFSHVDKNGYSPFDRMDLYQIDYMAAGENLAFAPNTELAMRGLMDSPGHRANILSENFNKVGVGAMDAGVYGKMFVQEFSD